MKAIKAPNELSEAPYYHSALLLNGVSIVESCTQAHDKRTTMFLEDHLILFVLEGTHHIRLGNKSYTVNKNEMILLKKSICVEFHKQGNPDKDFAYESMMFFLKEEFLMDFIRMAAIKSLVTDEVVQVSVKPFGERLLTFLESLRPYFRDPDEIDAGLVRIKMLELLYDLVNTDKNLLLQLIQFKQPIRTDIIRVMEENYLNPVSLSGLAYLSGRSLSSFRRDFQSIYQINPAEWIRNKRLAKARELLASTPMPIADMCYQIGFENVSHFSRLYKSFYGHTPTDERLISSIGK
jgi:AraC-like DNA-binding protein